MNIFLISGFAGAGKSTVAKALQTLRPAAKITAFAKHVKDFVAEKYDIEREMFETQEGKNKIVESTHGIFTVRDLLILHAESMKRKHGDDVWVQRVIEEIKAHPETQEWILEDWRFSNEYNVLRTVFSGTGIHRIRVINNNSEPYNKAEECIAKEPIHCIIDNTNHDCEKQLEQFHSEVPSPLKGISPPFVTPLMKSKNID